MNPAAFLLLLLLLCGCTVSTSFGDDASLPTPTSGTEAQQREAADAARNYLAMLDARQYDQTWDHAGPALKATSNRFMWTNSLRMMGGAFTPLSPRRIEGFGFTSKVDPAAPVGEYVLVQFQSRSGAVTLTEKVVMQKDQGRWKLVGYFPSKQATIKSGD